VSEAKITVVGFDELASGSKRLFGKIGDRAVKDFERIAGQQAGTVRGRVPRETGRLAGSVTSFREGERAIVGMGDGVPYAGWIEFGGTRGRPYLPQGRYLFPVVSGAEPQVVAAGTRAADREIGGFQWKTPSP
jgi:phage gpG-like protein